MDTYDLFQLCLVLTPTLLVEKFGHTLSAQQIGLIVLLKGKVSYQALTLLYDAAKRQPDPALFEKEVERVLSRFKGDLSEIISYSNETVALDTFLTRMLPYSTLFNLTYKNQRLKNPEIARSL